MLPPGPANYFFSVGGKNELSDEHCQVLANKKKLKKLNVPKTNIIENIIQINEPITKTFLTNMRCIPRPPPKSLKGRESIKTPWDFFKSVFRDYKPDTNQLLTDCFEFDWSNSKITKIIKSEEELQKIKTFLKGVYKHIRETYKYYAGVDPAG